MTRQMILAGLVSFLTLACGGSSGMPTQPNPSGDIQVGNNFFKPTTFSVPPATTVTWFWNPGGVVHNIVFDDGAPGSGNQSSGTFQRNFTTAGTFTFFCSIHGRAVMSGSVTVTAAGTGTGGGGTPTGGGGTPTGGGGYAGGM